jgi:DNA-binding IclR family transcriptional regulator
MNPILGLIDEKIVEILKTFKKNKDKQMYLREISRISKIPPATTLRILRKLSQQKIIEETQISKFKFYKYNENKKIELIR